MVKRKIILFSCLILLLVACNNSKSQNVWNMIDTVWEKQGEFCSDSLHFYIEGQYQEYYCEFQDHMYGDYRIDGDTLILVEYQLSSEIISDNPKPIPRYKWKYLFLTSNELQEVYYEDIITGEKQIGIEITWMYLKVK